MSALLAPFSDQSRRSVADLAFHQSTLKIEDGLRALISNMDVRHVCL